MILRNSPLHEALKDTLIEAKNEKVYTPWIKALKDPENSALDGFLAVWDYGFPNELFSTCPYNSLDDWLRNVEKWEEDLFDPQSQSDLGSLILHHLWKRFSSNLIQSLREARVNSGIPIAGGILAFIGGLSRCLVIRYRFTADIPKLNIVAVIKNPKSAFDFWGAVDYANVTARNHLKNILSTGHKLVFHRGVLIHVDKRVEIDVFGPSIDTLVLSEILAQEIFESQENNLTSALEIGSGNGLLTASLANHCKNLQELFAIDIDFSSISCTRRNVFSRDNFIINRKNLSTYFIAGEFKPDLINRRFDLVVCNPPYIPIPPSIRTKNQVADYFQAVGGMQLLETILSSIMDFLKPGGKMLLMTSSLSFHDTLSLIPSDSKVTQPLGRKGFEVIFDVEAVFNKPEWLTYLKRHRGLISKDKLYFHTLHPIWITAPQNNQGVPK